MASELLMINPAKKRKAKRKPVSRRARKKSTRSFRRNPVKLDLKNVVKESLLPSATAAAGAVGLDILMGYLPLPENIKSGPMRYLVKGAGAIGLGMIAGMMGAKPNTAKMLTSGALTVAMYEGAKGAIAKAAPDLASRAGWELSGYEDWDDDFAVSGLGYTSATDMLRSPSITSHDMGMYDYAGEEIYM